jgi:hypothetical protein
MVAVKEYKSDDLPDLSYTEDDVEELAKVLLDGGYRPEHVVLLTRARGAKEPRFLPTAERIRVELDQLLKKCGKDDLVLVAFAGHGFQPKNSKEFSFCPFESKLDAPATLVSLNEIYQKLEACPAGFKLLLADACRNDPGTRAARPQPLEQRVASVSRPQDMKPPGGVMAFYSCSAGQYAYEPADLKHGVFFHFLIEGLKGKADFDGDGQVIREELEHYVKKQVRTYVVENLRKEQWPHLSGESNDQRPLVTLAGKEPAPKPKPEAPRKKFGPSVLLSEDFREATRGDLPKDWDSETINVSKDAAGRPCLEVRTKEGMQYVRLPQMLIAGDFFVELELLLSTHHRLQVQLEGPGAGTSVEMDFQGNVTLQDMKPRQAEGFKADEPHRFVLAREGNIYRVSVDNSIISAGPLPYKGAFDHVRLGLTAGDYQAAQLAKIYAVKVGSLSPFAGKPDETAASPAGRTLLEENFRKVAVGDRPEGWDCPAFSVFKDKGGRTCLESRAKEEMQSMRLPRLAIKGDFFVECEFFLSTHHKFQLHMESLQGNLPIEVDFQGNVKLGEAPARQAEGFKADEPHRFRLVRKGATYRVSLDDVDVTAGDLPYKGDFAHVRLGLTAGDYQAAYLAKLYAVRVGVLSPAKADAGKQGKPGAAAGVREDFSKTKVGALPEGWIAAANNLSVQKDGDRPALQLTDPSTTADNVTLSPVSLTDAFQLECEFAMPDANTFLTFQLEGKPDRLLRLRIKGDGKMVMQDRLPGDASKAWNKPGETNRLRLERTAEAYVVRVNDKPVGALRADLVPGELEKVKIALEIKSKTDRSPRVYSVRVVPADAQDGNQ